MAMYLELSRPFGDVSRWEKVLKRLTLLNNQYPLDDPRCDKIKFMRDFEASSDIKHKLYLMAEEPSISLVTILHNWSNFCKVFQYTWDVLDYPKKKLEWIIVDTSLKDHSELIPSEENILYIRINSEDYLDKIDFKYDDDIPIIGWSFSIENRLLIGRK